jgi:hypothetical protein
MITWNYEFFLVPHLIAPEPTKAFASLAHMMRHGYKIRFLEPSFRDAIIEELRIKKVRVLEGSEHLEFQNSVFDDAVKLFSNKEKIALLADVSCPWYDLAAIKYQVHQGHKYCYYFENILVFRLYHDISKIKFATEVMRIVTQFEESGFQALWWSWEQSYFRIRQKRIENKWLRNNEVQQPYISFLNLLSLFAMLSGLCVLCIMALYFEVVLRRLI